MKTTKNKARNQRFATKRAMSNDKDLGEESVKRDSMRACRRCYGRGAGK